MTLTEARERLARACGDRRHISVTASADRHPNALNPGTYDTEEFEVYVSAGKKGGESWMETGPSLTALVEQYERSVGVGATAPECIDAACAGVGLDPPAVVLGQGEYARPWPNQYPGGVRGGWTCGECERVEEYDDDE